MTSLDALISDIIRREDDPRNPGVVTNDPDDSGGRTQYGLTEKDNPEEWADGKVTPEEARARYLKTYVMPFMGIQNEHLLHQLVDHGVPSGTKASIKLLQQIVGATVDGVLGPKTLAKVEAFKGGYLFGIPVPGFVLLNLAFRDARTLFYAATAKRRPKDLKYLLGWIKRNQEFK